MHKRGNLKGFTLLEVLIVFAIMVVIARIGSGFYLNYGKIVEIDAVAQNISFNLKRAQSRAMIGEGTYKWGVRFNNTATDYYELFSTPTDYTDAGKVIAATYYLASGVQFSDPTSGNTKDIIFNKITGGTTASSVALSANGNTKTVSVTALGLISNQ